MDKDTTFFDDKSLADVLQDIYKKSNTKDKKISELLNDLKDLVKTTNDAVLVVPLIKEYIEISVKNDEQLIKIATIMQRAIGSNVVDNNNPWDIISDEEKAQIEQEIKTTYDKKTAQLQTKTNELIEKIKTNNEKN